MRFALALSNAGELVRPSPAQPLQYLDEQLIVQQQWIELNLPALRDLTIGPLILAAINGRGKSYILRHDSYIISPLKS